MVRWANTPTRVRKSSASFVDDYHFGKNEAMLQPMDKKFGLEGKTPNGFKDPLIRIAISKLVPIDESPIGIYKKSSFCW